MQQTLDRMTDPARDALDGARPDLDAILALHPRPQGDPAFDPALIASNAERLQTFPEIDTGHPLLDSAVRIGLAHIDATFQGDHPKYGVGGYALTRHDTFPPIIIAAVDALTVWGLGPRAARLWRHWLLHFVRDDGTIAYQGTSLAEMGQLLHTALILTERVGVGTEAWWRDGGDALHRIARHLLELAADAGSRNDLIAGVPEDDERDKIRRYFHNNAWVARGLGDWAVLRHGRDGSGAPSREAARALASRTIDAIRQTWPADPSDWWLPPQLEPLDRPERITASREGSYTNYRYWPELLSSGILPSDLANRVVEARLHGGGQFCGVTRFMDWLDDWPLADYLEGVWHLGRRDDFLLSLYGHVALHQAEGHLTAWEQVTMPPGGRKADYCLPCQLVAPRACRFLQTR